MPKDSLAKNKIKISTQQYLEISEIRDDVLIMKDGTLRALLDVTSVNFALKSEDEQNAIISSYASFLNNLSFPVQIVIQSRELDIDNYMNKLKQKEKEQTNELLKMQTAEYIQYVRELVSIGKIMNKSFYVCVPYNALSDNHKNFFSSVKEVFKPATVIRLKEKKFFRHKREINRRIESVTSSLYSLGVEVKQLDTQNLIKLFYNIYNPTTSKREKMVDTNKLRVVE